MVKIADSCGLKILGSAHLWSALLPQLTSLLAVYALGLSPPSSLPYSLTDGAMPALISLMHVPESKQHTAIVHGKQALQFI